MSRRLHIVISLLASTSLGACLTDGGPTDQTSLRPSLLVVAGDGVTAAVGSPVNVTVRITGVPNLNQQTVSFVVIAGGGTVYAPAVRADRPTSGPGAGQNGVASNVWTYGTTSGPQVLEARLINSNTGAPVLVGRLTGTATPGPATQLSVTQGDNQSTTVGTAVALAPRVRVTDQFSNAISGVIVTFAVSQGNGGVTGATPTTDASGFASLGSWTLGPVAGLNQLSVTGPSLGPVLVSAQGRAAVAANLVTSQRVFSPGVGTVITPVARVTDALGNGIANAAVTFTVRSGGGSLDGVGALTALTDASGYASVNWTVGSTVSSNALQATAQGLLGSPLTFVAIPFQCDCWSTKAPLPIVRRDIGAGAINGLIYASVGSLTGGTYFANHDAYDPTTDQWTSRASVAAAYAFPAGGAVNGIFYLASGFGPTGILDRLQGYDPISNLWSAQAPIPTKRIQAGSAVLNGLMYVLGGDGTGNATSTTAVEAYDPALDQWIAKTPLPTARIEAHAAVVGGRIYLVGGRSPSQPLSRVDVYDPAGNSWTASSPLPSARYGATVVSVNDLLYVIGGLDPAKLAIVDVFDPATNVWVTRAPMPTARGGAVGVVVGGKIYVLSGRNDNGVEAFGTNEVYQP